jgi:hypothetical protein
VRLAQAQVRPVLGGRTDRDGELFADPDPERARRAMQAMLGMDKLAIAALRSAADGIPAT